MKIYWRLFPLLRPYVWPYFSLAILLMLAYGATDGIIPFLVQRIMDDVFGKRNEAVLAYLPWSIIQGFAVRGLLSFSESFLTE